MMTYDNVVIETGSLAKVWELLKWNFNVYCHKINKYKGYAWWSSVIYVVQIKKVIARTILSLKEGSERIETLSPAIHSGSNNKHACISNSIYMVDK